MQPRRARRLLFLLFFLALPLPILGPWGGLVPAARHWILLGATSAVALAEGAAGPVPGILALFAVHAVGGTLLCLALAWAAARGLARLAPRERTRVVVAAWVVGVAAAVAFEVYVTPFGRAATANLVGVLS